MTTYHTGRNIVSRKLKLRHSGRDKKENIICIFDPGKSAYPKVPTTRVVMWVTEGLLEKIFASPKSET